ncbi:MAG: carboxylesterase/lipase family protein [Selenomonadaceae bacterium]|nr:carboxylesterase/lipase family protein [Selenomonadaceae bacterium]
MSENLNVKTRYGTFNGFVDEKGVSTWLGIPYAKPPVGNLRWHAPQPLQATDKTFDAKKFGAAAVQAVDPTEDANSYSVQSEDCLTLNIWKRGEKNNLPVMVFIHGGGFSVGGSVDSLYNGSNFAAAHDVIIVTINYRLNVFGFLNLAAIDSNFEDSGYLGIKDQIAALKWVKENISAFGGNPDNVTVFGQSAGSISTMLLTVTPAAKNLFTKAIPQSATLCFYNTPEDTAKTAEKFMATGGVKTVGELMKKSSDEILNIYLKVSAGGIGENPSEYLPTCDGKFLPLNPLKALKDGAANGIKFLTGNVADEWRLWMQFDENFFKKVRANHKKYSPILSRYTAQTPEEVYKAWLKNRPDTEENFIDFAVQSDWRVGQEVAAEYQSQFEDVYFYVFTHRLNDVVRACHDSDLPYTFNVMEGLPNAAPNLAKAVQAALAAFAATGNPDNEFMPHWEKYSADNRQTMELNSKGCTCHKDFNTENLNSLRYVYEK